MTAELLICQKEIDEAALKALPKRRLNQIVACMHAQNELSVLNRLLVFSLNDLGDGQLHDHAHGVQMWTIMQLLTGKLHETWKLLYHRFLKANPLDAAVAALSEAHKMDLEFLKNYFSNKKAPLSIIRDNTAFHYDKDLDVSDAASETADEERRIYLAPHPINGVYYLGSALMFRTVFAMIADAVSDASSMSQIERMQEGAQIALKDLNDVNMLFANVLYGIISAALDEPSYAPLAKDGRTLIPVEGAPRTVDVALPMFVNVG